MTLDNPKMLFLPVAMMATVLAGCQHHLLAQPGATAPAVQPAAQPIGSIQGIATINVKSTQIAEIDNTHLRIAVDLSAVPTRSITLENLRLTGLRLNGLPVYAQPLAEPIVLVKGNETALPPLYVTLQLRDLTTTKPLREMVENQSVHLTGAMVASVKMSFFEKLAVHTEHPRVSFPVSQDVPVSFGSTPFARQAALGILTLADVALQGSNAARKNIPGLESPWIHSLETQANTDLMTVETSFVLKERDGQFPVVFDQLGFRLASGQIVTTAESKSPWAYDTDFLGRIKSGEAKLDRKSVEMQLKTTGSPEDAPLLLTHKDFSLEERGNAEKDPLLVPKTSSTSQDGSQDSGDPGIAKIGVRRRAEPTTMLLMVLHAPPAAGGFHAAPAAIAQQDSWEKVAIYRLNLDPNTGKPSVEVVQLSAHRDGLGIHLDESVDPSFFGSPIMVPEGVLGIVQDEQAGAFLPVDLVTAAAATAETPANPDTNPPSL
jgi:hypothetical protein